MRECENITKKHDFEKHLHVQNWSQMYKLHSCSCTIADAGFHRLPVADATAKITARHATMHLP